MKKYFIEPLENRLRSFWRILLFTAVFFGLILILQIGIGVVAVFIAVFSGMDFRNPDALTNALIQNPIVLLLSAASGLVVILPCYFAASRWIDRRPFASYGFHINRGWWLDLFFGLFLGVFLMSLIFAAEYSAGWVTVLQWGDFSNMGIILAFVAMYICVGVYEEMLSRGYWMRNFAEGFQGKYLNRKMAILLAYLLSSAVFGFLHAGNPNATLLSTVDLMAAGLLLGFGYFLTGELAIPIGLHITWNFFEGNVFGFPVSGMESLASIIRIKQNGPLDWTGGLFGPEAGWMGLLAVPVGCVLICLWVWLRKRSVRIDEGIATYTPGQ